MAWLHSRQKLSADKFFCIYGYVTPRPSKYRCSNVSLRLFIFAGLLACIEHPSTTETSHNGVKHRYMQQ